MTLSKFPEIEAVLDTNILFELCSRSDLDKSYQEYENEIDNTKFIDHSVIVSRRAKASYSLMLAMYFHMHNITVYCDKNEIERVLNLSVNRLASHKIDIQNTKNFSNVFLYFVKPVLLSNWEVKFLSSNENMIGNAIDTFLVETAYEIGVPIISHEGSKPDGTISKKDSKIREEAESIGVKIYTPEQYLAERDFPSYIPEQFLEGYINASTDFSKKYNLNFDESFLKTTLGYYEEILFGKNNMGQFYSVSSSLPNPKSRLSNYAGKE